MKTKFKKGDIVYWIEQDEAPYSGLDDPSDWIAKGKVISIYSDGGIESLEPYPTYVVCKESPIDGCDTDYVIEEDQLFSDVSPIYDSVIKNLAGRIAVLQKRLEYIKERKKHSSELQ